MALAKAKLIEIRRETKGEPELGDQLEVQFNPATLKLTLANQVDQQHTQGQQRRQPKTGCQTSAHRHLRDAWGFHAKAQRSQREMQRARSLRTSLCDLCALA